MSNKMEEGYNSFKCFNKFGKSNKYVRLENIHSLICFKFMHNFTYSVVYVSM